MRLISLSILFALGAQTASAQQSYDCVIYPSQVLQLGSASDGIIEEMFVSRGDRVKAGDMVAQLESEAEKASLTYATERAEDMGPIEIAQSRVELLKAASGRATEMGKRKIMPEAQIEQVQTEYQVAQLELRRAEVDQRLAKLDVERVEAQLRRRAIRSPIDGIVTTRMMGPGEYVYSQTPVAEVAQVDPLYVEVFLPTTLYPDLAVDQKGSVFPAEPIGGEYSATIVVVDSVFDAASDTFGVRLALPNPEGKLPAGIDCRVAFSN
ncbi:efflux RND transporter periplasmic adaptor subunit [Sinirhodobacter sp. WL0062]|uniref:Efflux RND transporter periplasmic adaptor subunit n=1 Tax=Rhodobacter flavimaris TaxID=2907145 RepID=A0ABS8YXF3_9RHOB|nr:efflux RND transporter periplasmic adaptor subunit [Sinirhodobacter sp. WL0062]MCE5974353.1 efflux RND transporter periplasmic adaptor subunit [Sinirhodobacter sp. WL0062]